jgi:ribosomal protein S27E
VSQDQHTLSASLGPAIAELERAHTEFSFLFKRQLPLPVYTILPKGRRNAAGWFWANRWQLGPDQRLPEINVCAEYLARPVKDIAELLLHEMCHYANWLDGIRDCSSSQYHNQKFRRRCDSIGLLCAKGPRGWAYTSLSNKLKRVVATVNLNPEAFKLNRGELPRIYTTAPKPESRLLRYLCFGCPKPKPIYASRDLNVNCNLCHTLYVECPAS